MTANSRIILSIILKLLILIKGDQRDPVVEV
jgi:hypothetical protein